MNLQTISAWLKRYGWAYQILDDSSAVLAGFATDDVEFLIAFQYESPWLRISLPIFVPDIPTVQQRDIYELLLSSHHQPSLVRFALDDRKRLIVLADLYAEQGLEYPQFEAALDALSMTAETTYAPLMRAIKGELSDESNQ